MAKRVELQRVGLRDPLADGLDRNLQQLWIEPGLRLLPAREQDLNLLPPRVDRVVALVLVVTQRGEIPHTVRELSERFGEPERVEQTLRAARQRALQRGVSRRCPPRVVCTRPPTPPSSGRCRRRFHLKRSGISLAIAAAGLRRFRRGDVGRRIELGGCHFATIPRVTVPDTTCDPRTRPRFLSACAVRQEAHAEEEKASPRRSLS